MECVHMRHSRRVKKGDKGFSPEPPSTKRQVTNRRNFNPGWTFPLAPLEKRLYNWSSTLTATNLNSSVTSGQSVGWTDRRTDGGGISKESVMVSASSVGRKRVIAPDTRSEVLVCRRSRSIWKNWGGWSAVISQRSRWFKGQSGRWHCLLKRNDRWLSAITPQKTLRLSSLRQRGVDCTRCAEIATTTMGSLPRQWGVTERPRARTLAYSSARLFAQPVN